MTRLCGACGSPVLPAERTPSTIELPSYASRTGILYCACGNDKDEIVYVLVNATFNPDKVTPLGVTFYKASSSDGAPILAVEANTAKASLNFWQAFSSGGSIVWNVAKGGTLHGVRWELCRACCALRAMRCVLPQSSGW